MTKTPQVGDRVTVSFEVEVLRTDPHDGCLVTFAGTEKTGWIHQSYITAIHPRPLKEGDEALVPVSTFARATKVTIVAIDGTTAWVKWSSGARGEFDLADLERVP